MKQATTKIYEHLEENDDRAIFYSREIGGRRIVIIPKDAFEPISETPTSYVLTEKLPI